MILFTLSVFLFLVGCLDYKAYELSSNNTSQGQDLVKDDLVEIEKQVDQIAKESNEVEGKVVLPSLKENQTAPLEEATAENLQILTGKENQLIRIKLSSTDPDGDKVLYSFSKPFNVRGEWKTNYGDAGDYIVMVTATDGKLTSEKKIKVVVQRVNVAPVIEGVKDLSYNEGETVKFEPKITDLNRDPVTLIISSPLDKGVWATDSKSSGEYNIKVIASDGELKTEKSFKLTIKNVNLAPVIEGLKDLTVKEGQTVKLEPVVTDVDAEEGGKLMINYTLPIGPDGTWVTGYTDNGVYNVNVTVNDGRGGIVTKPVKITVEDVNMPPVIEKITLEVR